MPPQGRNERPPPDRCRIGAAPTAEGPRGRGEPAEVAEDGDKDLTKATTAEAVDGEVDGGVDDDEEVANASVEEVGMATGEGVRVVALEKESEDLWAVHADIVSIQLEYRFNVLICLGQSKAI